LPFIFVFHLDRQMVMMFRFWQMRLRFVGACCFAYALFFALCVTSRAQSSESGPTPQGLIAPPASTGNARFFWCRGVSNAGELDAYVAAGFDTLVVPLEWRTGDAGDETFAAPLALAREGAKRKLRIIYALPAAPSDVRGTRISAASPSYCAVWNTWAQGAISTLSNTPNLAGWMLPDDSRSLVSFDDGSFRRYLRAHFASIGALNARWRTAYDSFDSINTDDIAATVAARQNQTRGGGNDALPPLGTALPALTDANDGAGFHPASLFLADWKASEWSDLMAQWAATIRESDPKHLVFSGACPDYAQLLAMPEGVDVSTAAIGPNVAENDIVTGNPQALDIARHGQSHAAITQISLAGTPDLPPDALAQVLPRWMDAAIAHGSRGVAFSDFSDLKTSAPLGKTLTQTLKRIKAESQSEGSDAPVASFAVLLEPLAEGATLQMGEVPAPRGLFGFGEGLSSGEPSNLVASLRWGTAFGGADFLSPSDLSRADLSRYSTILAPQLLDCSPETASKLSDYVRGGGVLVADLGLGALQNGGSPDVLPPSLALLAGGVGPFTMHNAAFNVRGAQSHPLFPTWAKVLADRPGMTLSSGDGHDGTAFDGPTGFSAPPSEAGVLATGAAQGTLRANLSIARAGRGFFVFAPFHLWANWQPGQAGFDGFFGDLFARGANLAVPTDALTPFPSGTTFGTTRFPEVVNRATSLTFLNHSAGEGDAQNVSVQTTGTGDWLWSNALVRLDNSTDAPVGDARPAPVSAPDDLEKRARPLSLFTVVRAGERLVCHQRPISAQNLSGTGLTARINAETASSLALSVWGETYQIGVPMTGHGWEPLALDGQSPFRITVVDSRDGYRCPPGSRHRVLIQDVGAPASSYNKKSALTTQLVVADERGRLRIEWTGGTSQIQIAPDAARR